MIQKIEDEQGTDSHVDEPASDRRHDSLPSRQLDSGGDSIDATNDSGHADEYGCEEPSASPQKQHSPGGGRGR